MPASRSLSLSDLVLARLLTAKPATGQSVTALANGLAAYLPATLDARERRSALATTIAALRERSSIRDGTGNRLLLSDGGVDAIRATLGQTVSPPVRWPLVVTSLLARALALPTPNAAQRRRLGSADGLRAAVLRDRYALALPPYSTLLQTRDALCWYCLHHAPEQPGLVVGCGESIGRPFSIAAVAGRLLSNLLASDSAPDAATALRRLAANAAEAGRDSTDALRAAVIARALANASAAAPDADVPLEQFVDRVNAVAGDCDHGRFGRNRLLITALFEDYRQRYPDTALDAFKQQLLLAHRQRLLTLARADLQEAVAAADLAASEIQYLGARFHFLQTR